jgi:hypothetical protein
VEYRLPKSQYNGIRPVSLNKNSKMYPAYYKVLQCKEQCYPADITATESVASVKLQSLLNHTVQRILKAQSDVIESLPVDKRHDLQLICKWGCDGTSGQSTYKQNFSAGSSTSDANIFFTSLVPLQLTFVNEKDKSEIIVWKNPRSSPTRFCRPIKIQFLHETAETTKAEYELIKAEDENLVPFESNMYRRNIRVHFKLAFTMVDDKVINSVTETKATMCYYLCKSTSKQFNDIDEILKKEICDDNLQFGISSLHAWIRCMECCLKLSYKLDIKKWQTRKCDKDNFEANKKNVQQGFKERLGLIIDQPKQGYGSSNDGNTARRFFSNYSISAEITGVDEELIRRIYIILQAMSCGFQIDVQKFQKYTEETARKFVELYPWFYMSPTVHKILIHGYKIIDSFLLPIGQRSEETQESCNKFIKRFREDFARKCSREKNLRDVFQFNNVRSLHF